MGANLVLPHVALGLEPEETSEQMSQEVSLEAKRSSQLSLDERLNILGKQKKDDKIKLCKRKKSDEKKKSKKLSTVEGNIAQADSRSKPTVAEQRKRFGSGAEVSGSRVAGIVGFGAAQVEKSGSAGVSGSKRTGIAWPTAAEVARLGSAGVSGSKGTGIVGPSAAEVERSGSAGVSGSKRTGIVWPSSAEVGISGSAGDSGSRIVGIVESSVVEIAEPSSGEAVQPSVVGIVDSSVAEAARSGSAEASGSRITETVESSAAEAARSGSAEVSGSRVARIIDSIVAGAARSGSAEATGSRITGIVESSAAGVAGQSSGSVAEDLDPSVQELVPPRGSVASQVSHPSILKSTKQISSYSSIIDYPTAEQVSDKYQQTSLTISSMEHEIEAEKESYITVCDKNLQTSEMNLPEKFLDCNRLYMGEYKDLNKPKSPSTETQAGSSSDKSVEVPSEESSSTCHCCPHCSRTNKPRYYHDVEYEPKRRHNICRCRYYNAPPPPPLPCHSCDTYDECTCTSDDSEPEFPPRYNLPYQNNEDYLNLMRELEFTLQKRTRSRVKRAMLEFESKSRYNRRLDRPIICYDELCDNEENVRQRMSLFNDKKCCNCEDEDEDEEESKSKEDVRVRNSQGSRWKLDKVTGEWYKVSKQFPYKMSRGQSPPGKDTCCECCASKNYVLPKIGAIKDE